MIEEVYSSSLDTKGLAQTLEDTFRAEGYNVQELGSGDDIVVQIEKESIGRAIDGMQQAITVRMQKQNDVTRVSLGQAKWADKSGVEIIGAIVLRPLMLPATHDEVRENTLPGKVINVVDYYAGTSTPMRSSLIACPKCGVTNSADSQFCSACGTSLKDF
jgi:zinc-ribbon domain